MKITAFDPMLKPEAVLALRLREYPSGVALVACDPVSGLDVADGMILSITEKGITRTQQVTPKVGLPRDQYRRVVIYGQELPDSVVQTARRLETFALTKLEGDYPIASYPDGRDRVTASELLELLKHLPEYK